MGHFIGYRKSEAEIKEACNTKPNYEFTLNENTYLWIMMRVFIKI